MDRSHRCILCLERFYASKILTDAIYFTLNQITAVLYPTKSNRNTEYSSSFTTRVIFGEYSLPESFIRHGFRGQARVWDIALEFQSVGRGFNPRWRPHCGIPMFPLARHFSLDMSVGLVSTLFWHRLVSTPFWQRFLNRGMMMINTLFLFFIVFLMP